MKLLLISPYSDIASIGLRIIGTCAREAGHTVQMVFLPNTPGEENRLDDRDHSYPETVVDTLGALAADCDIVGITVMTNYMHRARMISGIVRRNGHPAVVWGGIHATVRPVECLDTADYVVIGEGEYAFCDLVDALECGSDVSAIPNVGLKTADGVRINPVRALIQDLDRLPFPDYGPDNHYIWDREAGDLVPMTMDLLKKHLALGPISRIRNTVTYQTLATRGCPHRCAYCCNDVLQDMYKGQKHLRRRSDQNVFSEMAQVLEKYPFINAIGFSDDSFFVASDKSIVDFAAIYGARIRLPFFCLGSPLTITEIKLEALLGAGLYGIQMGVQTGSRRIQEIYQRPIPNSKVLEAVHLLHRYRDRMVPPSYDFIIDSPWETSNDLIETLQLIRQFPRPYRLQLFSLVIFPETLLYHKARSENLLDDAGEPRLEYHKRKATYVNLVLGLYRHNLPKIFLDLLSHPLMVRLFHRKSMNVVYRFLYAGGRWLNRTIFQRR